MTNPIDYNKIPTIIRRYSLESKFRFCMDKSMSYISPTRPPIENFSNNIFPHELETFFMFSIMFREERNANIIEHSNILKKIMEAIDEKTVGIIQKGNSNFANNAEQTYFPLQNQIQENSLIVFSRYLYFFSFVNENVNMKTAFFNKFNVDYEKIIGLFQVLSNILAIGNFRIPFHFKNIFLNAITKYCRNKGYLDNFIIERDKYIKEQNLTCNGKIDNYMFCVKYIYQYPFILFNSSLFLPLPHVLRPAFTESLLFRLMDKNQKLKTLFGKEVFESYLFDLFNSTNIYDSVTREQKVGKGLSSDVIIKSNNHYVFIEGKTTFPRAGLKVFDKKAEEFTFDLFSKTVIEIFNSISNYCKINKINRDNCYGVYVNVMDDALSLRLKYEQFELHNDISEEDYKYIQSHIKSIRLYELEELCCLSHVRIDDILSKWAKCDDHAFDITIERKYNRGAIPLGLLKSSHDKIMEISKDFVKELQSFIPS